MSPRSKAWPDRARLGRCLHTQIFFSSMSLSPFVLTDKDHQLSASPRQYCINPGLGSTLGSLGKGGGDSLMCIKAATLVLHRN